jgi:type III secretory pathway component EscV
MARPRSGDPEVHRITTARRSHSADLDARVGRYLLAMLIRTICLVLVFVVPGWQRWVFAVAAIFLPYVAVVLANAGRTRQAPPDTAVVRPTHRQPENRRPLPHQDHPPPEGGHPNG